MPKYVEDIYPTDETSSAEELEKKPVDKKGIKKRPHRSAPSCIGVRSGGSRSAGGGARSDAKRAKAENKSTAADLFGSDSEDDVSAPSANGKNVPPLVSYVMRRVTNGYSRRANPLKSGGTFHRVKDL